MSSHLMRRNARYIRFLARASQARKRQLLASAPDDLIDSLSEGALNVIKGKIPLTKAKLNRLRKHRKQIRELADPKNNISRRRALLLSRQRGGFLGTLASVLIPTIASIIATQV